MGAMKQLLFEETEKKYRIFQGKETGQICGVSCKEAEPEKWYFEPVDYAGDVLWSEPFESEGDAFDGAMDALMNNWDGE